MGLVRREKDLKVTDSLETVASAASRLGCSRDTVINLIAKGELRATTDKPIFVNKADVSARIRRMLKQAGVTV